MLTTRTLDVLKAVHLGAGTVKQIASTCGMSEQHAWRYLALLRDLGVRTYVERKGRHRTARTIVAWGIFDPVHLQRHWRNTK